MKTIKTIILIIIMCIVISFLGSLSTIQIMIALPIFIIIFYIGFNLIK